MSSTSQVVNVLDFIPKPEHAAIKKGNSSYDCTRNIQSAIDAGSRVYIPSGVYPVTQLNLKSNLEMYGDGESSELKALDDSLACEFMVATYVKDGGTSNPADNMRHIHLHDFKLNGRVDEFGYSQYYYLLAVNATSDLTVERVLFRGFRGDGMYVGSGTLRGTERHNQRVLVRGCTFDGVVKDNRNGLSIIDCDHLIVDSCVFRNIGNAQLSHSVGGIDFEPDHDWSVYRDILIIRCKFIDISSTNTAGITFFNGHQKNGNIHNWVVRDCQFENCYWGIDTSAKPKTLDSEPDNLTVLNCRFTNSVRWDISVGGLSNVQVSACIFERAPGSGPGGDAIRLGAIASKTSRNAIKSVITGNQFTGIKPQMGAIGVLGATGLVCAGNVFVDIYGSCINFSEDESPDDKRKIDQVVISGNVARLSSAALAKAVPMSFLSTSAQMRITRGKLALDQSFEYDNSVDAGVRKVANAAEIKFLGTMPSS
ncbi:Pectate lyase superfamily protein [Dyella jiangningensis]|uniref:glycosyl hydrolase family 28-related protein n=1 Tax=Dyella sp. AtDHG13 TaxID=1938897 RepID=UPI0008870E6C|nr:glycosyl hydrolase family 28-related protein [Dyella sp. AtDHG13]PXV60522.1 pectate lyase-like protein [Dyella sp. AtDHG13]SDJ48770.1 Pectate lyase superfamily protein [Dyella jiangningensis]